MGDMAVTINIGTLLGVIATLAGAFVGWFFGSSGSRKLAKQAGYFFVDWAGQPARDGVAAIPGVMARLAGHDDALAAGAKADHDAADALTEIRAELRTNGGSSVRDEIRAIKPALAQVEVAVASARTEVAQLAATVATFPTGQLAVAGSNHAQGG